ncbi:HEPN domain-containing protein [Pectobacterium brasiliense]|uniref:HEPN domain-containing protein n=1 Tax=Pectobacterium brasiliense TaxID=180957 RepID=UPI0005831A7D|nr:HEPN domain-containing protein [Pectobacterium brasiliense]KHT22019.1 hypothetical protein RC95_09265 [Pectobacterium brasiliense]
MKIEYILIQESNSTFCNNENSISKLLEFDNEIEFKDTEKFKFNNLNFNITAKKINSDDTKKNYFTVELSTNEIESDSLAESITKLNRKLIKIFENIFKETPKILINDLDSYYSKKAYPIIKDIENLMRQVLTKLLITKVGIAWEVDSVPEEMKGKINKTKGREVKTNYLSGLDFIDLTYFIFNKYSNYKNEIIFSEIEKPTEEVSIDKLKGMIPKSNWERYLNNHMKFTENDILIKWAKLYDLRCAVAHNTGFAKKDFDETVKIVSEIKPILTSSLDNLENSKNKSNNEQSENEEKSTSESEEESKDVRPNEDTPDTKPKEEKKKISSLQLKTREYTSGDAFPALETLRRKISYNDNVKSPSEKLLESLKSKNPHIDDFKSPSDKLLESLRSQNPHIDDFKSPSDKLLELLKSKNPYIDNIMKLNSSPIHNLPKSLIKRSDEIEKPKKLTKKKDDDYL